MKKLLALMIVAALMTAPVQARPVVKRYTDSNGTLVGKSVRDSSGRTQYYNAYGRKTGSSNTYYRPNRR